MMWSWKKVPMYCIQLHERSTSTYVSREYESVYQERLSFSYCLFFFSLSYNLLLSYCETGVMAITRVALEPDNEEGEWRTGGRAGYVTTWRNRVEWRDSQVSIFNSHGNNLSFAVSAFDAVSFLSRALGLRCALNIYRTCHVDIAIRVCRADVRGWVLIPVRGRDGFPPCMFYNRQCRLPSRGMSSGDTYPLDPSSGVGRGPRLIGHDRF
jgi:hypothetical protein